MRPDANLGSRADRITYADTDPLANANRHAEFRRHADTVARSDLPSWSGLHDGNAGTDCDSDPNGCSDPDAKTHSHRHADCSSNRNGDRRANCGRSRYE